MQNEIGVTLLNSNAAERKGADSLEAMKQYANNQDYKWYYAVDENSQIADAFGAIRTPKNFLFNNKGKLTYHGAIDDNPVDAGVTRKHLWIAMEEMLSSTDVSVIKTRSVE